VAVNHILAKGLILYLILLFKRISKEINGLLLLTLISKIQSTSHSWLRTYLNNYLKNSRIIKLQTDGLFQELLTLEHYIQTRSSVVMLEILSLIMILNNFSILLFKDAILDLKWMEV